MKKKGKDSLGSSGRSGDAKEERQMPLARLGEARLASVSRYIFSANYPSNVSLS